MAAPQLTSAMDPGTRPRIGLRPGPGGARGCDNADLLRERKDDSREDSTLGIAVVRALFEGKWRFDVIRCLCEKPQRLSTLGRLIPNASKKMLVDTLHTLEARGWIVHQELSSKAKVVGYALSDAWAERLRMVVRWISNTP